MGSYQEAPKAALRESARWKAQTSPDSHTGRAAEVQAEGPLWGAWSKVGRRCVGQGSI
jgi:hypothetical protein